MEILEEKIEVKSNSRCGFYCSENVDKNGWICDRRQVQTIEFSAGLVFK